MRVLAEMGLLLVLGLALAWLVGLRSDGVFIAGLLLAVSVAGLVESPCVKRNGTLVSIGAIAADMALAGVVGHIPADEVIDAMAEVGNAMSKDLRETGIGGLAGTPTGRAICEIVTMDNGEEED